jgi:hypothetical protein
MGASWRVTGSEWVVEIEGLGKGAMMTDTELQHMRGVLPPQRHALIGTLCAAVAEEQQLESAFLAQLADVHTRANKF